MTVGRLVAMRGLLDVKNLIRLPSVSFWCVKLSFSRIMLHFAKYGQKSSSLLLYFPLVGRPCPLLGLMLDKPGPQGAQAHGNVVFPIFVYKNDCSGQLL